MASTGFPPCWRTYLITFFSRPFYYRAAAPRLSVCSRTRGYMMVFNSMRSSHGWQKRHVGGQTLRPPRPMFHCRGRAVGLAGGRGLTSCSGSRAGSAPPALGPHRRGRPAAECGWVGPESETAAGGPAESPRRTCNTHTHTLMKARKHENMH